MDARGWPIAPGLDVMISDAFNMLNPFSLSIVLGGISEGRCCTTLFIVLDDFKSMEPLQGLLSGAPGWVNGI